MKTIPLLLLMLGFVGCKSQARSPMNNATHYLLVTLLVSALSLAQSA